VQVSTYLVGDLDKQEKDNEDKQVVDDTDSSDDDVNNFKYLIADVGKIVRRIFRFERRRDILQRKTRQRRVFHRCRELGKRLLAFVRFMYQLLGQRQPSSGALVRLLDAALAYRPWKR